MALYAIVLVIEAEDEDDVLRTLRLDEDLGSREVLEDRWRFVGEPWRVHAMVPGHDDPEFDTLTCLDQHPGR